MPSDMIAVTEYMNVSAAAGLVEAELGGSGTPSASCAACERRVAGLEVELRRVPAKPPVRTTSSVASVGAVVAGCEVVEVEPPQRGQQQRKDDDGEADRDLHTGGTRILRAGSRIAACPVRSIA